MDYNPINWAFEWNIIAIIWRIILNEIVLNNSRLPILCGCGRITAVEAFFHTDRTASFNVLIYVVSGVIYVTEDGTDYAVGPGELLFLKSGVHHYGKRPIPKETCWYYFHFNYEDCGDAPAFDVFAPEAGFSDALCFSAVLPKKMTGLSGGEIERKIAEVTEYRYGGDRLREWSANRYFFELLTDIAMFEFAEKNEQSSANRICGWLSRHSAEPFSAAALEREFRLSYKRMAALFKRDKGMTMQQYHNEARMKNACMLLRSTLLSVGEISERMGFDDMFYFSRCFRKYAGVSPSEYRRNAQKDY